MTITFSNLGVSAAPDFFNNSDLSSYSTGSWTPPTSGLILCFVGDRISTSGSAPTPPAPTVSGNGITWTQISTVLWRVVSGTARVRLTLFAANASGSSTGATTIDFGGNVRVRCDASFFLAEGVDLSGGVAAAFVQAATNSSTLSNSLSVSLAAAGHADNRPVAGVYTDVNEDVTPRASWTEADDSGSSSPVSRLATQYREDAFDSAASASWTTADHCGIIAAELKAAVAGGSTAVPVFTYHLTQQGIG